MSDRAYCHCCKGIVDADIFMDKSTGATLVRCLNCGTYDLDGITHCEICGEEMPEFHYPRLCDDCGQEVNQFLNEAIDNIRNMTSTPLERNDVIDIIGEELNRL